MNKKTFIITGLLEMSITFILGLLCYFFIIAELGENKPHLHFAKSFDWLDYTLAFFFVFSFLGRDLFPGGGPIKRLFGIKIVDGNNQNAPIWKSTIRNITDLLFPLEFVFLFVHPERRISDYLLNTRLILTPPSRVWNPIGSSLFALVQSLAISILIMQVLPQGGPQLNDLNYSDQRSVYLDKTIQDLLVAYGVIDVKVFEQNEIDSSEFISIILYLNDNYSANESIDDIEALSQIYFDALFKNINATVRFRLTRRESDYQYFNEIFSEYPKK